MEKPLSDPVGGPVDFYFDFISPYAYLASTRIGSIAGRHGRAVTWRPVLLGITVLKVMGMKPLMEVPLKGDYIAHDKPRMARLLGVPLVQRDMTGVNSLRALRAFLWLDAQDPLQATRFATAVFEQLWVHGQDITATADLLPLAEPLGIDAGMLSEVVDSPRWKDALRVAVDRAIERKVFGTPFFIVDDEPIWGVDRLWMLEHWLTHRSWSAQPPAG